MAGKARRGNSRQARMVAAREAVGMSQESVAAALGVTQSQYSRYESGKAQITAAHFFLLARILRVSPVELWGD